MRERGFMRLSRVTVTVLAATAMAAGLPGPAPAYEAVAVSDGGTIKGKVVLAGSPPAKRKVIPTKDREVCGSGVREVDPTRPSRTPSSISKTWRGARPGRSRR
jgi:hypothetical protein